jgi:hypothetical protein
MATTFSTKSLQRVLTFPFEDPEWKNKILIGVGLSLAGMFVPIIPGLMAMGYMYQIMYRLIVENGDLYLPKWDDWELFLKNGWRLFSVTFVYNLPMVLISVFGFVVYFASMLGMAAQGDTSSDPVITIMMLVGMGIFFLSIAITIILWIGVSAIMPAVIGHTVAHGSFSAGFDFTGWWKVLKANPGGFLLTLLILSGMLAVIYIVSQVFYITIVLICLIFIIPLIASFYMMLVGGAMIGAAYREGAEKLQKAG